MINDKISFSFSVKEVIKNLKREYGITEVYSKDFFKYKIQEYIIADVTSTLDTKVFDRLLKEVFLDLKIK